MLNIEKPHFLIKILLIKGILIVRTKTLLVFMEEKERTAFGLGLIIAFCL